LPHIQCLFNVLVSTINRVPPIQRVFYVPRRIHYLSLWVRLLPSHMVLLSFHLPTLFLIFGGCTVNPLSCWKVDKFIVLILDPRSHIAFLFNDLSTCQCRVNGPGSAYFFGKYALLFSCFPSWPGVFSFSAPLFSALFNSRFTYLFTIFQYFNPFSRVPTFFFLVLNETFWGAESSSIIRHVSWLTRRYTYVSLSSMFTMHISYSPIVFLSFSRFVKFCNNLVNSS